MSRVRDRMPMDSKWALVGVILMGVTSIASAGPARAGDRMNGLETAAGQFRTYVLGQTEASLAAVRTLRDRVVAHDLEGAQRAWLAARAGWERSEIVTSEYFPELDRAIDAWPDATRGFHAIEARLFGAHSTDVADAAEELVKNLAEFEGRLQGTTLSAQHLLNAAARLAYEIGEDKAGGGESPFSGNSLAEIGNNVEAIAAAQKAVFAPFATRDGRLAKQVAADLHQLQSLLQVPGLSSIDQTALRERSESLTADLSEQGRQMGLANPSLGN